MLNKLFYSVVLLLLFATTSHAQQAIVAPVSDAVNSHSLKAGASDSFVISDIRVEGLQRIPAGSVFASLPFNIDDLVTPALVREAISVLFRSGNFNDVAMSRDADVLVITLQAYIFMMLTIVYLNQAHEHGDH